MSFRVGDVVYSGGGQPQLVSARDKASGKILVQSDKAKVKQEHRHGYLNGLNRENRNEFNAAMDEIRAISDPRERITTLQQKIDKLGIDPKQRQLARYLTAEMAHIMNSEGIQARNYSIDEIDVS